jgi:hypothetical protein
MLLLAVDSVTVAASLPRLEVSHSLPGGILGTPMATDAHVYPRGNIIRSGIVDGSRITVLRMLRAGTVACLAGVVLSHGQPEVNVTLKILADIAVAHRTGLVSNLHCL